MSFNLAEINWLAVLASIVTGQILSTVWFVVLFGEPWAKEYGAADRKAHTADIPGFTYGVQALCTAVLVLSLALLHQALHIQTVGAALQLGAVVAIGFVVVNILPGQAFLKRWRVAAITAGCQSVMVLGISLVLGLWQSPV